MLSFDAIEERSCSLISSDEQEHIAYIGAEFRISDYSVLHAVVLPCVGQRFDSIFFQGAIPGGLLQLTPKRKTGKYLASFP